MKAAVDTNIFVYAEGLDGAERQAPALELLQRLRPEVRTVPVNVLGELFNVLARKAQLNLKEALRRTLIWTRWGAVSASTATAMGAAMQLAVEHRLQVWDALVLAVAAETDCSLLLLEDMQDGFTWRGVTVVDPFAPTPSPLLADVLRP